MKRFAIFLASLVILPGLISGMGAKTELEDKDERHKIIKEALESLEAFSNNLFARKVTKVS
jgi:hypothetical protein